MQTPWQCVQDLVIFSFFRNISCFHHVKELWAHQWHIGIESAAENPVPLLQNHHGSFQQLFGYGTDQPPPRHKKTFKASCQKSFLDRGKPWLPQHCAGQFAFQCFRKWYHWYQSSLKKSKPILPILPILQFFRLLICQADQSTAAACSASHRATLWTALQWC